MGASSKAAIPVMARHPLEAPDSLTTLELMGQAAVTEEFPFQAETSSPMPAKKASRAQRRSSLGFMARAQA